LAGELGLSVPVRDTIVEAAAVITADVSRRVLEPGWVRVHGGRIAGVGGGAPPRGAGSSILRGDVVMPGLVSAHQHLVDVLVRGGPTGPTFLDWLLGTYHGGLAAARPEDCALAVGAIRAAGLAAGITTVVDCWSVGPVDDAARVAECAEASIEAHRRSGGRTVFAPMFCEHVPAPWLGGRWGIDPARLCRPVDVSLAAVEAIAARHHRADGGRTSVTPSPELPEMTTDGGLVAAAALAAQLGMVMPTHLCASPESRAAFGPTDLERIGLLGPRVLGAHCSAVDGRDIAMLGGARVGIAHCPSAARALGATQFTPVAALRRAGSRCGIGLDNASLHNGSDLFAEAREAMSVAHAAGEPVDVAAMLDLLTIEGAAAVGLSAEIGSLEVGKRADLVVLDTGGPHWVPGAGSWPATVVACARASDVQAAFVDGHVVAMGGVATSPVDRAALDQAAARLQSLRGW
jgi:5-methylthioadenosine/S-adenosylhomocysteine deaminase